MLDFSPYATILCEGMMGRLKWHTLGIKVDKGVHQAVRVWVHPNWIENTPEVKCAGVPAWLKDGADWHAFRNSGFLCFEFDGRWTQVLKKLKKEPEISQNELANIAAEWLVTSASFLLYVHHRCHILGRTRWPETIGTWEHGNSAASAQLRDMNRQKKSV